MTFYSVHMFLIRLAYKDTVFMFFEEYMSNVYKKCQQKDHLFENKSGNNRTRSCNMKSSSFRVISETWGTFKFTPVPNVLLRFPGWTTCFLETVCKGVWDTFSLVWWLYQKCQPNQQQHVYKPRGIKETARTMGPSEVIYKCVCCSSVYATIRRHVYRKSFIVT